MHDFRDQVAVVTGASSGIGKAIAVALSKEGVSLCLVGRNKKTLEAVAEKVGAMAHRIKIFCLDLTLDEDVAKLKSGISKTFGHVDTLVHSAGIFSMGSLEKSPVEQMDRQYRTNVRAPYLLTQTLLPLIKTRKGQIVFINSSAGLTAKGQVGQYAATKHALKAIADSLREEVNADGVRVLSVYPGRTATPMQALVHEMEGKAYAPERLMQPEDVAMTVINALALPRSAEVTDIQIRPLSKPGGHSE